MEDAAKFVAENGSHFRGVLVKDGQIPDEITCADFERIVRRCACVLLEEERERETETEKEMSVVREGAGERETDRQTDRQRERERERDS